MSGRTPAMRILFAGIIARYPFGGVTWCSLMYLLGLRALGHEVFYIEDTGECVYDPVQNTRVDRSRPTAPPTSTTRSSRSVSATAGRSSTTTAAITAGAPTTVRRYCADADLFINLSGGSWFWRDEYARIPRKVFIDSDPAFTQLAIAKAEPWYVEFFQRFDHLFTFGANIGTPASPIPAGGFTWHKTWQPVTLDDWRTERAARRSLHDGHDLADRELHRRRRQQGSGVREVHRPAVADAAAASSWRSTARSSCCASTAGTTVDAMGVSRTPWDYRDFIQRSKAEFGVAKHTYVANRSGWFSDRTECYLASGRPALVQDTGWTAHLPSGDGLLAFSTPDEAIAGIDRINARLRAARAARRRDRARALRRARASCRGCSTRHARDAAANRPRRAGRHDDSAAASPARSRR